MFVFQANLSDDWLGFCVINMTVIPGKEVINPVYGGHGNMEGIADSFPSLDFHGTQLA